MLKETLLRDIPRMIKAAALQPDKVATIFPTLNSLATAVLDQAGIENASSVVELGPGTGAITRLLEPRMRPGTQYVGIEIGEYPVSVLRAQFPGLKFACDSAQNITRHVPAGSVDAIVSSLPWSLFSDELQKRIIASIHEALRPGGVFSSYVCLNASWYPSARQFRKHLGDTFAEVTKTPVIWKNIPPAFVYRCRKSA